VKVTVVKNRLGAAFRETEVDLLYGTGISREGDLLDLAVQQGMIQQSGPCYSLAGERIAEGRENARQTLVDRPELAKLLEAKLRAALGLPLSDMPGMSKHASAGDQKS
jgi:recombination protein RecA